jgi:hypothetical protein
MLVKGIIMRARGKDIVELFGYAPDDISQQAVMHFVQKKCPFIGTSCSKTNHDQTVTYGTCSVTAGRNREIVICPKRLYAENYKTLRDVSQSLWGDLPLVVGGSLQSLKNRALQEPSCIVAFGQNSGKEVSIQSNGKLSIDWVLQRYVKSGSKLDPKDFVAIEVQSIDITGNYRENFHAYERLKTTGNTPNSIPDAGHGLNWANVHKRLIPQIIRKGNVYSKMPTCSGFAFILPSLVYEKFDEILGDLPELEASSNQSLSVFTYSLGNNTENGSVRKIVLDNIKHHSLLDIATAFSSNSGDNAHLLLSESLKQILD